MDNYFLFLVIAAATIASPGPGVILTISNSLKYGFLGAIAGISGVAAGMFFIALISATSLAVILATSAFAFALLKYIGAAYLIYLGLKQWLSSSEIGVNEQAVTKSNKQKFTEGLFITLLNPKPIFFFLALFPQFINSAQSYPAQFLLLAATFSLLVVIIHCIYALFSNMAQSRLSTPGGGQAFRKVSGSCYLFFGIGLILADKKG